MRCRVRRHASLADVPSSDLRITGQLDVLVADYDFLFDPDLDVVDRPVRRNAAIATLNRKSRCPR
jgi:hypothetical protein